MGSWGAGIYDDDVAADLKNQLSLLIKIPAAGNRLLELILSTQGGTVDLSDDGAVFGLVVADQFERRGIHCQTVCDNAKAIIKSGADLQRIEGLGAGTRELEKRKKVLAELDARLNSPRKLRSLPASPKLPDAVVEVGEIYAFPTFDGKAGNAWIANAKQVSLMPAFVPNGWGALIILAQGRAFDWLPWCSVASLTVQSARPVTIDEVAESQLMMHPQTKGAAICVPDKLHLKRMEVQRIGRLELDAAKAQEWVSKLGVNSGIERGWSICAAAFGENFSGKPVLPRGARVAELLSKKTSQ